MKQLQTTAIIRQRGQLTIPDDVRKSRDWATSGSVVDIVSEKEDEIVIRPHKKQKKTDWDQLWKDLERVSSYKGKYKGSLSKFIAEDRQNRR